MRKKKRSGWVDVVGWVVLGIAGLYGVLAVAGWFARDAGFDAMAAQIARESLGESASVEDFEAAKREARVALEAIARQLP